MNATTPGTLSIRAHRRIFPLTSMSALAAIVGFATLAVLAGCETEDEPAPPPDYRSTYYRIDRIDLPQTTEEALDASLDLDGDGSTDNAGGNALVVLQSVIETAGERLPLTVQAGLDGGRVDWIVEIGRDTVVPGRAAAALHAGADSDQDGVYEIADGLALAGHGSEDGDAVRTGAGRGRVPASFLADVIGDWPVTWVNGIALAVSLRQPSTDEVEGLIGFATRGDFGPVVAGPLAELMTERLQAGTLVLAADMDADHDGIITEEEFLDSPLSQALLGPDVDLLDDDGSVDSMSAGFRVHASAVDVE
jgi:hypothetical protein